MFIRNHLFYFVSSSFFFNHFILLGIVRVEQKNNTFFDMNIFEDGPYEVGGETDHDESLVPVPANSYLGRNESRRHACLFRCLCVTPLSQDPGLLGWEEARVGARGLWLHLLEFKPWWSQGNLTDAWDPSRLTWACSKQEETYYSLLKSSVLLCGGLFPELVSASVTWGRLFMHGC